MRSHRYNHNKQLAVHRNTDPTMTDQSAEKDTDINVIVDMMRRTAGLPTLGRPENIVDIDLVDFPRDLRAMIETARSLQNHMSRLPPQLRNLGPAQLLALTPEQLTNILTPPEQPANVEEKK